MKIVYRIDKLLLLHLLCIFSFFLLSIITSEADETTGIDCNKPGPYVPDGYHLTFCDEFEMLQLDIHGDGSSNWAPWWVSWEARHLEGNADKAWKCDKSYIGGGEEPLGITLHEITEHATLKLYGRQTPPDKLKNVENFPYIGGMISADRSFSQTYGYWEIRCRFEVSKGYHWALWLLPTDNGWPPEIDIVEVVGHQPDKAHMTAHWNGENGKKSNFQTFDNVTTSEFHTYGFEWTSETMVWYLDGLEMKRMDNFVNNPMYILLSPEIGSNWTGLPDETTVWPAVCEVDYIKIYNK